MMGITASWNSSLQQAPCDYLGSDALALIRTLFPPLVQLYGAPLNTTHYFIIRHSPDGAGCRWSHESAENYHRRCKPG